MVDQEPHRSVQLIRRIDTRIPAPLLSQAISSAPSLGKLVDLRSPAAQKSLGDSPAVPKTAMAKSPWGRVPSPSPLLGSAAAKVGPSQGPAPVSETPSSHDRGGVWVSPSVQAQRARESASANEVVPDNWEDDT